MGARQAARQPGRGPARPPGRLPRRPVARLLRQGARLRGLGRGGHRQAADHLVAHPRARPGSNGKPRPTGCSATTCGCTGRAGRRAGPAAPSWRSAWPGWPPRSVAMVAFAPWWGWALAAVALFVAFAHGRAPARQDHHDQGRAARAGAAADRRRHHPRARLDRRRRDQQGDRRERVPAAAEPGPRGRPRLARGARPALRRHRHAGDRPARAARLRAAPPARRGVARAGQPRARGRLELWVGRADIVQGQAARLAAAAGRAGRRLRSRSRSASTSAAASSRRRWRT